MGEFGSQFRESPISRIVGVEDENQEKVLNVLNTETKEKNLDAGKLEHSKGLDEILILVNTFMGEFMQEYGMTPVRLRSDQIHVLDVENAPEEIKQRYQSGSRAFWRPISQKLYVLTPYTDGKKLEFLHKLVHELVHVQSFHSLEQNKNDYTHTLDYGDQELFLKMRRLGLVIFDSQDNQLFTDWNEALTTDLEIEFENRYLSLLPDISDEYNELLEKRNEAKQRQLLNNDEKSELEIAFLKKNPVENNDEEEVYGSWFPYYEERKKLDNLIHDLYLQNQGSFEKEFQIRKLFVEAFFKGNLLPLARLVEKTYGKGSFRRLGTETAKMNE